MVYSISKSQFINSICGDVNTAPNALISVFKKAADIKMLTPNGYQFQRDGAVTQWEAQLLYDRLNIDKVEGISAQELSAGITTISMDNTIQSIWEPQTYLPETLIWRARAFLVRCMGTGTGFDAAPCKRMKSTPETVKRQRP